MWDDASKPTEETNFQRMLINNMEAIFSIFFQGMTVVRVRNKNNTDTASQNHRSLDKIE